MGREPVRFFRAVERGRERLWQLAEWGLHRLGVAPEQAQWRRDPVTGRWWEATSADVIRVERETPTAAELGRRAGEAVAGDPRYQERVREMVEGMKRPR